MLRSNGNAQYYDTLQIGTELRNTNFIRFRQLNFKILYRRCLAHHSDSAGHRLFIDR